MKLRLLTSYSVPNYVIPYWRSRSSFKPCPEPSSMKLTSRTQSTGRLRDAMSRGCRAPDRGMLRRCVGLAITQGSKPAGGCPVPVPIVDDESLARRGVVLRLRKFKDVEIVGECGDGQSALYRLAILRNYQKSFRASCPARANATAPMRPGLEHRVPIDGLRPSIQRWRSAHPPAPPCGFRRRPRNRARLVRTPASRCHQRPPAVPPESRIQSAWPSPRLSIIAN